MELNSYGVAGSFQSPEKYAYMIFARLKNKGKIVFPVYPALQELEGQRCFKNILEIEGPIEALSLVTPPRATRAIVRQALEKGVKYIWMQPGAEDDEAIGFCEENNIHVIHHSCVLVWMSRLWR